MTDTVDQPGNEGTEATEPSLNEMLANLQKSIEESNDKRFSGIQSLLDRKTAEMDSALEELKVSRLSPADREEYEEEKTKKELAAAKRELEILRKAKDHPKEVEFLQKFLAQESLDAQLALLANYGTPTSATPTEGDEGDEPEPGVNLNNPPRRKQPSLGEILASGKMTKEAAEKLLTQNNERGALARGRG